MTRHALRILISIALVVLAGRSARASWDQWNCQLLAYYGCLPVDGCYPRGWCSSYLGVTPGATDGYDLIDSKHSMWDDGYCLLCWFDRPHWDYRYYHTDWRSAIAEGTSKRWGTAIDDTWNVRANCDEGSSGVFDPCAGDIEYLIAGSIYITWEFGVSEEPPAPLPPDDYTFSLIYRGGVQPKPPGTYSPDATVPPLNATWDMEATPHFVIPLWPRYFQTYTADCSGLAPIDVAKFHIVVTNPQDIPYCTIAVDPDEPWPEPATFTFTAEVLGDQPFTFSWDFGDGGTDTGNPVTHTYTAAGTYEVTCTVTDVHGDSATCTWQPEVTPPNQPPTCDITFSPAEPTTSDYISFYSHATDPDGSVASVTWDFGDGTSASGTNASHRYYTAGTYMVTATVVDNHGGQGTCSVEVVVTRANQGPTCDIVWSPLYAQLNETISFDSQASDADGFVVSVDWSFGDGATDSGVTTTHAYTEDGYYTVRATVCDNEGGCTTCRVLVYAGELTNPYSNWNCNVRAYWGAIGGTPQDASDYFGVVPGATDGYDLIDSKKPGPYSALGQTKPLRNYGDKGNYVYAWFEHPSWGQGDIMCDWRSPIPEGTTKQWGIDPPIPAMPVTDYWGVVTNYNAGEAGCMDPCWGVTQYPVAASIYIDWEFGIHELPPAPLPPEDYEFTIKYAGGLNAKPAGCTVPGVSVPVLNSTWDMDATPYVVVPVWSRLFLPYNYPICDGFLGVADRAKFFFIVNNPDTAPACAIGVDPPSPQEAPATFTFTATATGDVPLTYDWDFGDGGTDIGSPGSHTYAAGGTYTVACTVTDGNGDASTCTAVVEVTPSALCFDVIGDCRNMITIPGELVSTDPWEVFDELRPPNKELDLLSGNLARYDEGLQGYVIYYRWAPGQFGPIVPGEGYWLWAFYDEPICYDVVASSGAQARNLPVASWYLVGSPHAADCYLDDTLWYHGAEGPYPFSAIMNLWVQDPLIPWSCVSNSYGRCGLLPIDDDHYLRAFQGYWLYTFVGDVTMVVPP